MSMPDFGNLRLPDARKRRDAWALPRYLAALRAGKTFAELAREWGRDSADVRNISARLGLPPLRSGNPPARKPCAEARALARNNRRARRVS